MSEWNSILGENASLMFKIIRRLLIFLGACKSVYAKLMSRTSGFTVVLQTVVNCY